MEMGFGMIGMGFVAIVQASRVFLNERLREKTKSCGLLYIYI